MIGHSLRGLSSGSFGWQDIEQVQVKNKERADASSILQGFMPISWPALPMLSSESSYLATGDELWRSRAMSS